MAQSIPTGKAYRQLCNYRNIVFHVKVGNYNPDQVESEWIENSEKYPTIDIIHGLLAFYEFGEGLKKLRAGTMSDRAV